MKTPVFIYNEREYFIDDIVNALNILGIRNGDSIFLHSDLRSFGKINKKNTKDEFLGSFVEALKKSVGKNGNIIMPTFSYSYCKKEIYNPKTTQSTVGVLTEYFRKLKGVKRSMDAIFSVAAMGPDSNYFVDVGTKCFGKKSIFEKLYDKNVKIVFLGETFDITYIHFIEQKCGVPYRYMKKFKGKTRFGNRLQNFIFDYYVRDLQENVVYDLERVADFLSSKKVLNNSKLGYSKIRVVLAVDAYNEITKGLKQDIYLLLKKQNK